MAEFNPKVDQVGTNNYINYSNRSSGNDAWGTLFEAVGKTADKFVQRGLKQQVNSAVAQADAQFLGIGVDPTNTGATTQQSTGEDVKPPPPTVPKPLESGLNDVKSMSKAYDAGSFSEKNYWTQVDSRIRQLRAQYPGYTDIIDGYVSDAINSPTANMLRKSIINEMDAQRKAEQDALDEDYKVIGNHLYLMNQEELAAYNNRSLDDNTRFQLKMRASQEEAADQQVVSAKARAELANSNRNYNNGMREDAEKEANKYVTGEVNQIFYKAYSQALGKDGASIKSIEDAVLKAKEDGQVTPDEIQKINQMAEPLITGLRSNVETVLNGTAQDGKAWSQIMRPEDLKSIRDFTEGQIGLIQKMVGGDTSLMKFTGELVTAQRNNEAFQVYKTDGGRIALQLGALADGSNGALTPYLQQQVTTMDGSGQMKTLGTVTKQIFMGEMLTKGTPLNDLVQQGSGEIPPSVMTAATRTTLEQGVKIIADDKVPVEQRAKVVMSLYGESGLEFMRKLDDAPDKFGISSRERVWRMMASPEVYSKVKEVGKTNPKALEDYQNFMKKSLRAVFKDSADTLQDAQIWSKYASARFDTTTGQWVVDIDESKFPSPQAARDFLLGGPITYAMAGPPGVPTPPGRAQGWGDQIELQKVRDMVGSVKRLNSMMLSLKPMLDDMGVKNQPEALLQVLGPVNLNAEKRQPLLDWLSESVTTMLSAGAPKPDQKVITAPGGIQVGISPDEVNAVTPAPAPAQEDVLEGGMTLKGLGTVKPKDKQGMVLPDGTQIEPASATPDTQMLPFDKETVSQGPINLDQVAAKSTETDSSELTPVGVAKQFLGFSEKTHSKAIGAFLKKSAGVSIDPAKTAWCAAFINGLMGATGREGTGKLNARSFLNYGTPTNKPTEGDIVVIKRGNEAWMGHVGLYMGEVTKGGKKYIKILGGNQNNSVSIAEYPADRLLGYRKPPKAGTDLQVAATQ